MLQKWLYFLTATKVTFFFFKLTNTTTAAINLTKEQLKSNLNTQASLCVYVCVCVCVCEVNDIHRQIWATFRSFKVKAFMQVFLCISGFKLACNNNFSSVTNNKLVMDKQHDIPIAYREHDLIYFFFFLPIILLYGWQHNHVKSQYNHINSQHDHWYKLAQDWHFTL